MQIESRVSDAVARYLDLAVAETKLTAGNMANVDTPGYRAQGIDFSSEMRKAIQSVDRGASATAPAVVAEEDLIARPDGNNVSMDRESLNLAEAQLKFRTGVSLLHQQYQLTMDAIHADK